MTTSLDATHHDSKNWLTFFPEKGRAFWFLVSFGKICAPISLNGVFKKYFVDHFPWRAFLTLNHIWPPNRCEHAELGRLSFVATENSLLFWHLFLCRCHIINIVLLFSRRIFSSRRSTTTTLGPRKKVIMQGDPWMVDTPILTQEFLRVWWERAELYVYLPIGRRA